MPTFRQSNMMGTMQTEREGTNEVVVRHNLCASFEPVIDEVFANEYRDIVEAARRRLAPATDSD